MLEVKKRLGLLWSLAIIALIAIAVNIAWVIMQYLDIIRQI